MQDLVLISIPETRIRIIVEQAVRDALHAQLPRQSVTERDAPPYVSKREAARLIGVCTSTIDNAARDGRLKRHYVGKAVRFAREQVLSLAKKV